MEILVVLLLFAFVIAFHEFGHFIFAKAFGIGVERFSIGFGPVIFSKKIGETVYCLSLLPLGGYVLMTQELPGQPIVDPKKSFHTKALWKKLLVFLAGPLFNLILALLMTIASYRIFGIPMPNTRIGEVASQSPADKAGLHPGDIITDIDGQQIKEWKQAVEKIHSIDQGTVTITVKRNERILSMTITPDRSSGHPRIGIAADKNPTRIYGLLHSLNLGVTNTALSLQMMVSGLQDLFTGKVSAKDTLGGPIQIVQVGTQVRQQLGWEGFLHFGALLSLSLGLLNLLPIPVVDGGQIFILLVVALWGKPLNPKIQIGIQLVGVIFLLLFFIYVTYNDISRILTH